MQELNTGDFIAANPINILILFVAIIVLGILGYGLKSALLVYIDCKNRGIKNKFKWVILALLFNDIGFQIYASATQRPQTLSSMTAPGIILEDTKPGTAKNKQNHLVLYIILVIG